MECYSAQMTASIEPIINASSYKMGKLKNIWFICSINEETYYEQDSGYYREFPEPKYKYSIEGFSLDPETLLFKQINEIYNNWKSALELKEKKEKEDDEYQEYLKLKEKYGDL